MIKVRDALRGVCGWIEEKKKEGNWFIVSAEWIDMKSGKIHKRVSAPMADPVAPPEFLNIPDQGDAGSEVEIWGDSEKGGYLGRFDNGFFLKFECKLVDQIGSRR